MNEQEKRKGKILNLAMLLGPSVIFLTLIIDMFTNISNFENISHMHTGVWTYFSFTLVFSIIGLLSCLQLIAPILKKDVKVSRVRTVVEISRLCYLLEVLYIIEYVVLLGNHIDGLAIATLVIGTIAMIGFIITPLLKGKRISNFVAYAISGFLYVIFMILIVALRNSEDHGIHIVLFIFYTLTILLSSYTIYWFYKMGGKKIKENQNK